MTSLDPRAEADLAEAVHRAVLAVSPADRAAVAARHARALAPLLDDGVRAGLVTRVLGRVDGLGPLEQLLADPEITEVLVNAGREVWVERHGQLQRMPVQLSDGEAAHAAEKIVTPLGLRLDRTSPVVDARLPDGSRVCALVPPVVPDGVCLAIRRFAARPVPLEAFASPPVVALLASLVDARLNLLVTGATSSGKTTFLNALGGLLPPGERVVTIEDACELRLAGDHVVRLEARPPTADGVGAVDIRALLRAALRLRPDRLVIGEVRGAEALELVHAMNTGHDGSLATCHANSPTDALARLATMVLQGEPSLPLSAVTQQVHASIDVVVHVRRGVGGHRRVASIEEVLVAGSRADESGKGVTRVLADDEQVLAAPERQRGHR